MVTHQNTSHLMANIKHQQESYRKDIVFAEFTLNAMADILQTAGIPIMGRTKESFTAQILERYYHFDRKLKAITAKPNPGDDSTFSIDGITIEFPGGQKKLPTGEAYDQEEFNESMLEWCMLEMQKIKTARDKSTFQK